MRGSANSLYIFLYKQVYIGDGNIPYFFHEFISIFECKRANSAGMDRESDGIDGLDGGLMFGRRCPYLMVRQPADGRTAQRVSGGPAEGYSSRI
jgi:hypothetical protein